eukprot:642059-Rhodomonas_salina.1
MMCCVMHAALWLADARESCDARARTRKRERVCVDVCDEVLSRPASIRATVCDADTLVQDLHALLASADR